MSDAPTFDAFRSLVLTVTEPPVGSVRTVRTYELRSERGGASIWLASGLDTGDCVCDDEPRFRGRLSSRQVIELLVELERSGIYELEPSTAGVSSSGAIVSMQLSARQRTHDVIARAPADDGCVRRVVAEIIRVVGQAQEHALVWAG